MGRPRVSFANVVSLVALFVALGGSAWALSKNSVGSKQLKAGAVKTKKIADAAVTSPKVADGSLSAGDFAAGQLPQGPEGPRGAEGPAGPAGPRGPSNLFYDEYDVGFPSVTTSYGNIANHSLPAGEFWVEWSTQATANAGGTNIEVTCRLQNGVAETFVERAVTSASSTKSETLVLSAHITGPVVVSPQCKTDTGTAAISQLRFGAIQVETASDVGNL